MGGLFKLEVVMKNVLKAYARMNVHNPPLPMYITPHFSHAVSITSSNKEVIEQIRLQQLHWITGNMHMQKE